MFFSRCRAALPHPLAVRSPAVRVPRWSQIRQLQTRRSQNPSQQPPKTLPQRASQPPPRQPATEPQYTTNPNEDGQFPGGQELPNVKVRFLVPTIWAITVSMGIYISLAYFTAKDELESKSSYHLFQGNSKPARAPSYSTYAPNGPPTPTEIVTRAWRDADPMAKLSWGLIGVNGAVHLSGLVAQRAWQHLWHIPATNRNYTLFTSTFVHAGPMHLGVNLYALYNFLPATGYSGLFRGDTNHMLSFFLSTGVLSGLAQHCAGMIFKQGRAYAPFISSGGASGALFAVFGAFCMEYPTQGVGIILIPWYMEAQYFLPIVMAFDLVGMVRGYSFVNFGHAAHLSGACIGAAYSYLDGRNKVWRPLVDFWKRRLQQR
ncbi:hypothetical protein P171DRAFT_375230 [Karstenula rhodostoma CBS 690.94]|uniref:Peptidase S54 rhomboid domain-containing protein n=1 Tax=Karstenula rhodostoma CBS 690.94 TaxID=1392251 RepID=A0A9P4UI12_9PLEO|nr:hypothetical protein P171DRAFT_375230 [Karstenula rhodostoma CBS 690.94]